MTFSDDITTLALDLARSLWAELGISGSPCRHDWQAVDLEPLILFTASLVGTDEPFLNRTVNWCAVNASYISPLRIRHLARRFAIVTGSYETYLQVGTTVRQQTASATEDGPNLVVPVDAPDLKRPSLIQLRLRALMGVGPRAEALRLLLADPQAPRSAKALALDGGYGTAAMGLALEALTAMGTVKVEQGGTVQRYRLTRPAELAIALNGVPVAFPDWISVLTVVAAIMAYASSGEHTPAGRMESATKLVSAMRNQFGHLGVTAKAPAIKDESSLAAFENWALTFVGEQAGATERAAAHEASYSVHRLALGGWIATVSIAGGQPRPLALSDVPLLRPERRSQRRPKEDPVAEAAAVVEMMLRDLLTMALQRRLGSTVSRTAPSEPDLHGLSRDFASELLMPMQPGQGTSFSEKFLHHWLANHRRWHGMTA